MYSLQPLVPHWKALLRIEAENAEHFLGPVPGLVGSAIASPTARVGQPLRFGEVVFAAPQGFLGTLLLAIKPRILERDGCLRREHLQHGDAVMSENVWGEIVFEIKETAEFCLVN